MLIDTAASLPVDCGLTMCATLTYNTRLEVRGRYVRHICTTPCLPDHQVSL